MDDLQPRCQTDSLEADKLNILNLYKDSKRRHLASVVFNQIKQYIQGIFNLTGKSTANVRHQISNNFLQ